LLAHGSCFRGMVRLPWPRCHFCDDEKCVQAMLLLAEACLSTPVLIWQKHSTFVMIGEDPTVDLTLYLWATPCFITALRLVCVGGSLLSCCKCAAGTADRAVSPLSYIMALWYFTGPFVSSNGHQLLFALCCVILGVVNVVLNRNFRYQASVPWLRLPVIEELVLERDHYSRRLRRWGTCCVVCLEDFQEGEEIARLPCGHSFHEECVSQWLLSHDRCPYRCTAEAVAKREEWEANAENAQDNDYDEIEAQFEDGIVNRCRANGEGVMLCCTCSGFVEIR